MTQPFQFSTAFSLWSLEDKVFFSGLTFAAGQLPAMLVPNSTYVVLDVKFDGPSGGKVVVTSSGVAKTCTTITAENIAPYVSPCDGSGPPPPYSTKASPAGALTMLADTASLTFDLPNTIWVQGPSTAFGPIGMWPDVATALAGVGASGPVGQLYWLLQINAANFWQGGYPLGTAPTQVDPIAGLLPAPFYITIPVTL